MSRVKTLGGLYIKNFAPEKVMVDSKVARFYEDLKEAEDVKYIPQIEEVKNDIDLEETIINCIKNFSGLYGKSGFRKILTGSSQIKANGYNDNVVNSEFFGALKGYSQKYVGDIIEELIEKKEIEVKKISFGRPVLCKN